MSPEMIATSRIQTRLRAANDAKDYRTVQLITLLGLLQIQRSLEEHPLGKALFPGQIAGMDNLLSQFAMTLSPDETDNTFGKDGFFSELSADFYADQEMFFAMKEKSGENLQ